MSETSSNRLEWDLDRSEKSPFVRKTVLTTKYVAEMVRRGWLRAEIVRMLPPLTEDDIDACLAYESPT